MNSTGSRLAGRCDESKRESTHRLAISRNSVIRVRLSSFILKVLTPPLSSLALPIEILPMILAARLQKMPPRADRKGQLLQLPALAKSGPSRHHWRKPYFRSLLQRSLSSCFSGHSLKVGRATDLGMPCLLILTTKTF